MIYAGDFPASHTAVCIPFDSFAAATGAPSATTNFAAADVLIYKDGSATPRSSAAGITVTTTFNSLTGLQMVKIDLSDNTDAGFYAAAHEFAVAVADITVDGQTLRFWLGTFSIERAGGVLALIKARLTGDIMARVGAPAGASIAADVAAVKVDTAAVKVQTDKFVFTVANQVDSNVIDWKSSAAPAMTGDAYARLGAPAGASVSADIAAAKVDTAAVKVQTDKLAFTVTNQIDANVLDWKSATAPAMTGDAYARLGAPAGASVSADVAAVKTDTAAIGAKTTNLPASPAAVGSAMTLTSGERDSIADAHLDRSNGIEAGLTPRNSQRLVAAATAGKLSGAATTTVTIRNAVADTKDRIAATVDSSGNRSAITVDLT